jgi:hypothetical protein
VNMRVRVDPGTNAATRGVVVEDFGEMQPQAVDLDSQYFADPADGARCSWTPAIWCTPAPTNSLPSDKYVGSIAAVSRWHWLTLLPWCRTVRDSHRPLTSVSSATTARLISQPVESVRCR